MTFNSDLLSEQEKLTLLSQLLNRQNSAQTQGTNPTLYGASINPSVLGALLGGGNDVNSINQTNPALLAYLSQITGTNTYTGIPPAFGSNVTFMKNGQQVRWQELDPYSPLNTGNSSAGWVPTYVPPINPTFDGSSNFGDLDLGANDPLFSASPYGTPPTSPFMRTTSPFMGATSPCFSADSSNSFGNANGITWGSNIDPNLQTGSNPPMFVRGAFQEYLNELKADIQTSFNTANQRIKNIVARGSTTIDPYTGTRRTTLPPGLKTIYDREVDVRQRARNTFEEVGRVENAFKRGGVSLDTARRYYEKWGGVVLDSSGGVDPLTGASTGPTRSTWDNIMTTHRGGVPAQLNCHFRRTQALRQAQQSANPLGGTFNGGSNFTSQGPSLYGGGTDASGPFRFLNRSGASTPLNSFF
ncbi:uncharacterized protein I303_103235 [Kwoniella dejecticola CBS 10117]|uniref:Uncharacterized protein n=1 Tax=Kwoniella dejecticola CBS 10117 TaxID=1296121 RepID=A0A1A6AB07_9TREE|nr:uncharacterized protein I303_03258 [Kwoniella dejecticola CBS 10117]OBR87233.1 hypothetical protein I303_03258 [Kwoniella dejecticola CBS 10117]